MLHVVTMLWDANKNTMPTSRCYNETWVEKLYNGFNRNLTVPFKFVLFSERERRLSKNIVQERMISSDKPDYGCFTEPYRLNQPMILVGLDTIIVRNIDHLAEWCLTENMIALPRDPYQPDRTINGVALVPPDRGEVYTRWNGENDMEWLRTFTTAYIDDLWPGHVVSLKFHDVRRRGLQDARIVYFHGRPKPHELNLPWIREHWR